MNPKLLFHNAASNIICQVLFARQFEYDDEFMKFFVDLIHETNKIINGRWGMVSHTQQQDIISKAVEVV